MAVGQAGRKAIDAAAEATALLEAVDASRREANSHLDPETRSALGQFLTPATIAKFMAEMFTARGPTLRVLDAGAGVGSLSAAFVAETLGRGRLPETISLVAYELDEHLLPILRANLERCRVAGERCGIRMETRAVGGDFVEIAADGLGADLFSSRSDERFDCAILNPPYHKIRSESQERLRLRAAGIETSNLYTAFLALAANLLAPEGEMVAITPRSFCNGPYFEPFRHHFLGLMRFRQVHVFESRDEAFSEDGVLQENVVFHAVRTRTNPPNVIISSNRGPSDPDLRVRRVGHDDLVSPADSRAFIHIVSDHRGDSIRDRVAAMDATLADLGLSVSTGRVVDFRARDFLRLEPSKGTVPLIYPCHMRDGYVAWPDSRNRKPNAIVRAPETEELLVPSVPYVLAKRFSAKEERRRVKAAVYDPARVHTDAVAFENHLNYFHCNGSGMAMDMARGLSAYLNSTLVDAYFRQFSGHTQVNATDLRSLRYPSASRLDQIGMRIGATFPPQGGIDALVDEVLGHG
jgi:adenine-specific DNA-methyltransferase